MEGGVEGGEELEEVRGGEGGGGGGGGGEGGGGGGAIHGEILRGVQYSAAIYIYIVN